MRRSSSHIYPLVRIPLLVIIKKQKGLQISTAMRPVLCQSQKCQQTGKVKNDTYLKNTDYKKWHYSLCINDVDYSTVLAFRRFMAVLCYGLPRDNKGVKIDSGTHIGVLSHISLSLFLDLVQQQNMFLFIIGCINLYKSRETSSGYRNHKNYSRKSSPLEAYNKEG